MMEPKERASSVLGALMGFDEQQSQRRVPRPSRVLSEGYLRRVASIGLGVTEKKSPRKHHPFGMTIDIEDPKEFISNLEVEHSFKSDRHCNKLRDRKNVNFTSSAAYLPVTREKFVNEKRLLTDKMVVDTSREFHDLPEVVDSMDISPRQTRERNCISNHVESEPSVFFHTQLQHITFSNSSYIPKEVSSNIGTEWKDREQGQAYSSKDLDLLKYSSPFLESRDELFLSSYSPSSLKGSNLGSKNYKEFRSSQYGVAEQTGRTGTRVLDGSRGETKHGSVNSIMNVPRSASIFYDDICRKETKFTKPPSSSVSNWKTESQNSVFFSVESYQARESKKKITEEQKMNEKSEQMLSRQGRKMSKMPIQPHHVTSLNDLNCKPVKCGIKKHVCSNKDHLYSGSPLCLSRKNGRLEQLSKNSPRFKFLSASTVTARSRNRSRFESLCYTWFLKSEGPANWLQRKPLDRNSNKMDASEPAKKLRVFPGSDLASDHIINDACMVVDDLKNRVEKKSLFDQRYFSSPPSRRSGIRRTRNNPVIQENQAIKLSLKNERWDDNLSIAASNIVAVKTDVVDFNNQEHDSMSLETDDDSSTYSSPTAYTSIQQLQEASTRFDKKGPGFEYCSSKELNSIVSLEEAYQPSPVSVLEPLFKEEILSGSESLKKSGINCRDLMVQLELLMSESSGTNSEGPEMVVSSDDDGGEGSMRSYEESGDIMNTFKFKDSRDFSYLVDVLTEAGLHCVTSHSQERHIISPSVFETLEKKFGEQISWRRSERKLLFDRIESGLIELFRSFVGVPEWIKPVSRRFRPLLSREMIEEELWILLDSQEREVSKDLLDKQFGKEIGWIDLGDEIDSVCRELEILLIEELVAEVCSMEFF